MPKKKYLQFIRKVTLRAKILLIFFVTWAITVVIVSGVTIRNQIEQEKNQHVQADISNLADVKQSIENYVDTVNMIGIRLTQNESVRLLLSDEYPNLSEGEQRVIYLSAARFLSDNALVASLNSVNSLYLLANDGRVYTNYYAVMQEYAFAGDAMDFFSMGERAGYGYTLEECTIGEETRGIVQYVRKFHLNLDTGECGGIVMLMKQKEFFNSFAEVASEKDWMMVEGAGTIICSRDQFLFGQNVADVFGVKLQDRQDGAFDIKSSCGGGLLIYSKSMKGNLYYTYFTPEAEILDVCEPIIRSMLMLAVFAFFILLALAWYLSKRFTSPMNKLEDIMIRWEQGDLGVRMNPRYDDEIGRLGQHFDRMIEKLTLLMENNKKIEEEKRRHELRVLQLQINPHFLYNTFSSIIWLANEKQIEEVIDITKSLSVYYRIALSSGHEMISVQDEILHVRNYINIQQYRYQDEFKYKCELEQGMEELIILKLVLQPLVENAIYHGAKTLQDGSAVIELRGYVYEDMMIFEVWDNGNEMTEEKAESLNRDLSQNLMRGIGTSNVNNRIRIQYGDSYGLRFMRKNGWTIAKINIPLQVRE